MRRIHVLLGAACLLTGCSCEDDAPYTPYSVGSGAPSGASSAATAPPVVASNTAAPKPPKFSRRAAVAAPKGSGKSWKLEGLTLVPPGSEELLQALVADLDGDGKKDAVSWSAAAGKPGKLAFHPSGGKPRVVLEQPGFVPTGPACKRKVSLSQSGPGSVTLDISASCSTRLLPRAPVRSVSVIAPGRSPKPVVTLRVSAPAAGEELKLEVDSSDRDADGLDDVSISVKVGSKSSGAVLATSRLAWYARAAGSSRDAAATRAGFDAESTRVVAASRRKASARNALFRIDALRRLWSSLCRTSGVPRILDGEGAAFDCSAQRAIGRLAPAEVEARLSLGQPGEALAAYTRAGWFGTPDSKAMEAAKKRLLAQFNRRPVAKMVKLEPRPVGAGPEPRYSPLTFREGALLVQTSDGVSRVQQGAEAVDVSDEIDRWPLSITGPAGERFAAVALSCDAAEVTLVSTGGQGQPIRTPVLAPRPGSCTGQAGPDQPGVVPLSWGPKGLEAVVAGTWVGAGITRAEAVMRPAVPGSGRSPDGKHEVVPTALGLLVFGDDKPALWEGGKLTDPKALRDCVIDSSTKNIACVAGNQAVWLEPT